MFSLGLHHDGQAWKMALVKRSGQGMDVQWIRSCPNKEPLKAFLQEALGSQKISISTALSSEKILLRSLVLEIRNPRNVLEALPFQAEDIIPYSKEEALLIPFFEKEASQGSTQGTLVRLVATCRSFLIEHINELEDLQIDPARVTTTVHAFQRWAAFTLPLEKTVKMLYLSKEGSFAGFVKNGILEEFKTFAWDRSGELRRIKHYFELVAESTSEENAPRWIIGGDLSLLNEEISFDSYEVSPEMQEFAIPLGICFDSLLDDKLSVQFRSEAFKSASFLSGRKKNLHLALILFVGTLAILGPIGSYLLNKHEESLFSRAQNIKESLLGETKKSSLDQTLSRLNKKIEELDKESKFGSYAPHVSMLLEKIAEASSFIRHEETPVLTSFDYRYNGHSGEASVEFTCVSKKAARDFKTHLKNLGNLKFTKWQENSPSYSLKIEIE